MLTGGTNQSEMSYSIEVPDKSDEDVTATEDEAHAK